MILYFNKNFKILLQNAMTSVRMSKTARSQQRAAGIFKYRYASHTQFRETAYDHTEDRLRPQVRETG